MNELLSPIDRQTLRRLEKLIDDNIKAFLKCGNALKEIRDNKLYRETHKTFEAYCEDRFEFGKSQAYRLIDAADEMASIQHLPGSEAITSVAQVSSIAKLKPEDKPSVLADIAASKKTKKSVNSIIKDKINETIDIPLSEAVDKIIEKRIEDDEAPPHTAGAADRRPKIWAAANKLDGLLSDLKAIAVTDGGQYVKKDLEMFENELMLLKQRIRSCAYHAICPSCDGRKCRTCLKTGWIAKNVLPMLSPTERDKLGIQ